MRRLGASALLALALAAGARADEPGTASERSLPIPPPERSFLLVDAPRRFVPGERAHVRVQLRDGGRVGVALFRVRDPASVLGLAGARQGIAVAQTPIGAEAEALLSGDLARGRRLELVSVRRVSMPKPRQARHVTDETQVYDSNETEEDDIATYWVQTGEWAVRDVPVGRLPAGLYLVRVHAGPWAATAVLSVGELVVLARRGDTHDTVLVTDRDGNPRAGIPVHVEVDGSAVRRGTTGADGAVQLRPSDAPTARFVARQGPDVAWADVLHARLDPCDPRVYLATGRPLYRSHETVYVRGHVRGCDRQGRYVPLANEPVRLSPVARGQPAEVRTDADGNFVARMGASGELVAEVRGQEQRRTIRLDHRSLPVRGIALEVDRAFATSGEVLRVEVKDEQGGWPIARDVVLDTPAGRFLGRVGPGTPAVFHVPVPSTVEPLERFPMHATLTDGNRVTTTSGEVWIGRTSTLLEIQTARERGAPGERIALSVRATSLAGEPRPGPVRLTVRATDGNRPGAPRRRSEARVDDTGAARVQVPLTGEGPWWIEATRGQATAHVVIWARERPPALSGRGPLAVQPAARRAEPQSRLAVDVRLPPGRGRAWLTLEQGSVWHRRVLSADPGRTVRVEMPVPGRARGLAKIVVAHVAAGRVATASATVEVATSEDVTLAATTDRRVYAQAERAKVTLAARRPDGSPAGGVATLWLADAGYWEMGEDDYPLPAEYLRLPGRMASAADSTQPIGYGAEEGRVLPDARMEWNGQRVDGTTYRHAWGHYGRVVRVRTSSGLREAARSLARAAGLRGAWVCPEAAREAGAVTLLAHDLPWDMVAVKIADRTTTWAHVEAGVLRFECGVAGAGGGGLGMGNGVGVPSIRTGAAGIGTIREERLEGTLLVGLRRLGPDGRLEIDLSLPDHPGRWRVEALVVGDDGGGARAHAVVHTQRALEVWTDLPARLAPGDEAPGAIHLRAPSLAGRPVDLAVQLPLALTVTERVPARVTLDARGEARVPLRLSAHDPGPAAIAVEARSGADHDAVRTRVEVLPSHAEHPVAMRALVGPETTDVHVPLPELVEPTTLSVAVDPGLRRSIEDVLDGLREPRWHVPSMRIDRLASLRALMDAAAHLPDSAERDLLETRLAHAHTSEAEALARLVSEGGGLAWWNGLADSGRLTAEALWALGSHADEERWAGAWDALRRRARAGGLEGEAAALASLVLAGSAERTDVEIARDLLDGARRGAPDQLARMTFAYRAAQRLGDETAADGLGDALGQALRSRVADGGTPGPCRGAVWFLCYRRWGERGDVARAASALLDARRDSRDVAVTALRWLARRGPTEAWWIWGTAEADVLALSSRVLPPAGAREPTMRVELDGRTVRLQNGRVQVPAGAHDLRLVFDGRSDRLVRVRVDGTVRTTPPTRHAGSAPLTRRFERDAEGVWSAHVELSVPAGARDVEVSLPLPAGLELSGGAEAPAGARMSVVEGTVLLRWDRGPGAAALRLPLVALARGVFQTAPARLRDGSGTHWALTAATTTTID